MEHWAKIGFELDLQVINLLVHTHNVMAPLWMGFNCLKATEPLRGDSLLFTAKPPGGPSTHLIDLGRMKG